jgi:hypothetical protein
MKIGIPSMWVTECRHIKVTRDTANESVEINFDNGVFVVVVTGTDDVAMPVLEIVEEGEASESP